MILDEITTIEFNKIGDKIIQMLNRRDYKSAKETYRNLDNDTQEYLENNPKYKWTVKAMRCSTL